MTQYGIDRFYNNEPVSFASCKLAHELRPGATGEIVIVGDGFQVTLPETIVDAIAAVRNDSRWPLQVLDLRD